jgi:hypothetical protein
MQLVLQATVCDCVALDPFAFEQCATKAAELGYAPLPRT